MPKANTSRPIDLAAKRRLRRALDFIAGLTRSKERQTVESPHPIVSDMYTISGLGLDIGVTRDVVPARRILAWTRLRQTSLILVRMRDPADPLVELTVDICLRDSGAVLLAGYSLFTTDARDWWFVGRDGELLLRIDPAGLVPTVTEQWNSEDAKWSGISEAEAWAGSYIWGG